MSEPFIASNGHAVVTEVSSMLISRPPLHIQYRLDPEMTAAAREFFQHERDQELGRWRDPETQERVVMQGHDDGWVQVWDEAHLKAEGTYTRYSFGHHLGNPHYPCAATAARYFAAHPVSKPWLLAEVGEVWVIELDGKPAAPFRVVRRYGGNLFVHMESQNGCIVNAPAITAGHRIYPEATA